MSDILVLDSGPLSDLADDPRKPRVARAWDRLEVAAGDGVIVVPEIADYEVRRELLRTGASRSIARLDRLKDRFLHDPITTAIMHQAAEFWAQLRRDGKPTSDPHALDADVILAAQAALLAGPGDRVAVVTTNARHLARLVEARDWASLA